MIYLRSFQLSDSQISNPHIYPYNVFRNKDIEPFVFTPITVFYGNNGSGKSTLLNIIANKLRLKGKENANMKILSRKCKMEHLKVKIYEKNKNNERKK